MKAASLIFIYDQNSQTNWKLNPLVNETKKVQCTIKGRVAI